MLAPIHKKEFKLNQLSPVFKDYPFLTQERHACPADHADVEFIFRELNKVPDSIKKLVLNNAFKLKVRRERNLYILNTTQKIVSLLPEKLRHSMTVDENEIRVIATDFADKCRRIALHHNKKGLNSSKSPNASERLENTLNQIVLVLKSEVPNSNQIPTLLSELQKAVKSETQNEFKQSDFKIKIETLLEKLKPFIRHSIPNSDAITQIKSELENQFPNSKYQKPNEIQIETSRNGRFRNVTKRFEPLTQICESNSAEIYQILSDYCETFRIKAPIISNKGVTELGAIKRMIDKNWWNRKLRNIFNQAYEQAAIELNLVHKYKQIYASDLTVTKRKQQLLRNEQMLSSMKVINDIGQQFTLKDLSDLNTSNPAIRKAELMVRMRGFEELSKSHGHQGIFITITCPSKYHAVYSKSGQRNAKYQSLTPYMGNQYLCALWSRIRAHWNRKDIKPYGFRVAEPQHDGTPHWHILLFAEPEHMNEIKKTISHYALEEDGDEKGAVENRCDFKMIDPNKGSATGYIAKYVSKNIDGEGLDKGVYGEDPITAAQRVDAWSSCWCIRQFQQIGGASVSVWRELRRLKKSLGIDEIIEKARIAADESNWDEYINAMGGVFAKRKDQPIKLAYDASFDTETGECKVGFYDGNIIQTIKGLMFKGHRILTRFFSWRLERANVVCDNLEFCK